MTSQSTRPATPRKVLIGLAVCYAAITIGINACRERPDARAGVPLDDLTIFYTADTRGHIEPCGCASGQAGGIARRMTYLRSTSPGSSLLVDAGDVTAGPRDWERFEMLYILRGYDAMGYDAVNAGHREASLGAKRLAELAAEFDFFVSANLVDDTGATVFPPYRVVDLPNGSRVGVIGVMDENIHTQDLGEGLKVLPAGDALATYLPTLTSECDMLVVLAFADEPAMRALAERFYEIDVIIGGDVLQPTHTPLTVNRSLLVSITDKGKAIGRLDLTFDENGAALAKENDIHMLLDNIPDDPEVGQIVDDFKLKLADMDFQPHRDDEEGLTTITAARSATANRYVTAQNCAECHPKAVETWEHSLHSHSFESLVKRRHEHNPRCLKCHTVGYGASDGYINQRLTPMLDAVSCGNCHGRGDYHARFHAGESVPERLATLRSVNCMTCHDPENSPEFDFATYWEQIKHGME